MENGNELLWYTLTGNLTKIRKKITPLKNNSGRYYIRREPFKYSYILRNHEAVVESLYYWTTLNFEITAALVFQLEIN